MNVRTNIDAVRGRIRAAAIAAGRDPDAIRLLAVSKAQPIAALEGAWDAGQRAFGENYVREAEMHMNALPGAEWHYIGKVQGNKSRDIAERFDWVHTLDNSRHAERLALQRPDALPPLDVCIQVNLDDEKKKGGTSAAGAKELATVIAGLARLRLRGLMAIPAATTDLGAQREAFAAVRRVFETLRAQDHSLDTLSMGMSGDLEAAIAEGATLVRIGTALFGPRP